MKIQVLISKKSWSQNYKKIILKKLKKFTNKLIFLTNHKYLKNNYDINIIFSYFKKIPSKYLKRSKYNLVPHESNLPKGKGMSPLTWQILEKKKKVTFSLIEANNKIDSGIIYFKKKVIIPKTFIFKEIKKTQLYTNLLLITKFINFLNTNKRPPKKLISKLKESFYKKRKPRDSEININKKLKDQFNLLRVVDNENYPAYFKIYGKKFYLRIEKK